MSDHSILAAVERARAGDPDAFAELFTRYDADVLRVCRRMLRHAESAEDARSEVFLRARRALDDYDSRRPFKTWLLSIAGHHCIDVLRRRATEQRVFAGDEPREAELHAPGPSPLSNMLAVEQRDALSAAIGSLPLRYRLPLLLRYFGELGYDEIAATLGVSRNQVGSLLFRAKRRLREQLETGEVAEGAGLETSDALPHRPRDRGARP